jgi:hypothetical protein
LKNAKKHFCFLDESWLGWGNGTLTSLPTVLAHGREAVLFRELHLIRHLGVFRSFALVIIRPDWLNQQVFSPQSPSAGGLQATLFALASNFFCPIITLVESVELLTQKT